MRSWGIGGWPLLVAGAVAVGLSGQPPQAACSSSCPTDTIGLDVSYADNSAGAVEGEALVQTFVARDTLIEFLRVWRIAIQSHDWYIGMHLYITETDANGQPDAHHVILDGPTLVIPEGDGVHPIEFKWTFDPPLALPHQGQYAFFLFQNPCGGYFDVLGTDQPLLYADGSLWNTDRSNCILYPSIGLDHYPQADLCFQIGFCRDVETATHQHTWGELKLLYR